MKVDKGTGKKSYREQDVPKITKDMLNLLRDRECFLLCSGRPTNRTHTGMMQVMNGIFDKDSPAFRSLLTTSREVHEIQQADGIKLIQENQTQVAVNNPFA